MHSYSDSNKKIWGKSMTNNQTPPATSETSESNQTRSGFVAIIGRPNVGKSTLMNHQLGIKLSITSRKPQTTRHRILGIKTIDDVQIVYVDTPGMHLGAKRQMNRHMNRVARASLEDINVVIFVIEALRWTDEDKQVLTLLENVSQPVILAINKVDQIKSRQALLPFMQARAAEYDYYKMIPISAKNGLQLETLEQEIIAALPEDHHYFSPDQFTDRSDRFVSAEMIREQLMRQLGQEIPYALTVTIDAFSEEDDLVRISAVVWVERDSQKSIVIGKKGERLKRVGMEARKTLQTYFEKKVYVQLWVKVKGGWSDDQKMLEQFGYNH